ncbi:MAG: hypothetical protein KAT32_03050 [Candidatus Moranbacteria bacterium]|nr:hypothetical protein [Candidatus Moranbacteria bacterium]
MQRIIITISITVLVTTLILVSAFMFFQNKEINIQERVEEITETQNDIVKTEIVSNQVNKEIEEEKTIEKGEKKVSIVVEGDMNYVIYTDESGEEFKIAEDGAFSNVRLSPRKDYILYGVTGHGGSEMTSTITKIYSISESRLVEAKVNGELDYNAFGDVRFTADQRYLYYCDIGSYFGGKISSAGVYEMKDNEAKLVFDIFGDIDELTGTTENYAGYMEKGCSHSEFENNIEFTIECEDDMCKSKKLYEVIEYKLK